MTIYIDPATAAICLILGFLIGYFVGTLRGRGF